MTTNPYETLGLKKDANAAAIKAAYRKMAKKHHPDVNNGDDTKFKQVNEANEILTDPVKKQNFDTFGTTDPAQSGFNRTSQHGAHHFEHVFRDVGGFEDFFNQFGGTRRRQARNADLLSDMQITLENAFNGITVPFEVKMPDGGTKNLRLTIPPGVETGQRFKMAGHGPQQNTNIPAGDLYVTIHVKEHASFKRLGADLYIIKTITIIDAALGKETEVPTIDGSNVKITIPPGIQPNHRMRLKNKGMPHFNATKRGDLYIGMDITVPTSMTPRQKELLEEFQNLSISEANKQ